MILISLLPYFLVAVSIFSIPHGDVGMINRCLHWRFEINKVVMKTYRSDESKSLVLLQLGILD